MAGGSQGISGTGLTALAGGSLLLFSAIKGRKWSEVLRELIAGQEPGSGTDYPITPATATQTPDQGAAGGATGTSGWDKAEASSYTGLRTASGRPMTGTTIASPYLPLGTVVEIEYKGKTVTGTVWDFGPADWVMVANPDRFLDIAIQMMQTLTGTASNVVKVNYRITTYGNGRIYRPGAAKTAELRKRWKR